MDQKYANYIMFQYYKDLDENLAWLTQKTEELKFNKGNFTPPFKYLFTYFARTYLRTLPSFITK